MLINLEGVSGPRTTFVRARGGKVVPPSHWGLTERRPKLVGWLIVLIIVLAIIGAVAVVRAIVR
jgi:hypothetical protein